MNPNRLWPYSIESRCPKCGSHATGNPKWHMKNSARYVSSDFPFFHFCVVYLLDHLHHKCNSCGYQYSVACADVNERELSK